MLIGQYIIGKNKNYNLRVVPIKIQIFENININFLGRSVINKTSTHFFIEQVSLYITKKILI